MSPCKGPPHFQLLWLAHHWESMKCQICCSVTVTIRKSKNMPEWLSRNPCSHTYCLWPLISLFTPIPTPQTLAFSSMIWRQKQCFTAEFSICEPLKQYLTILWVTCTSKQCYAFFSGIWFDTMCILTENSKKTSRQESYRVTKAALT